MQPFFFGTSDHPLLGLFHPPRGAMRSRAVLICGPIGHEYSRSQWALRQLADNLARAGFPVLRFDLSGQGDSAGSFEEASVSRWLEDVNLAMRELLDNAGLTRFDVIGLRLGATLAARALDRVERFVLWD